MKLFFSIMILLSFFDVGFSNEIKIESPKVSSIEQLNWMTGSWEGPVGEGLLEESWLPPKANTITAVVRLTKGAVTEFVELIKIEKIQQSLELRLNLFDSSLKPRSEKPQVLKLSRIGNKSVTFVGVTEGSHRELSYKLVNEDLFAIRIITAKGEKIAIDLKRL
ncbi:MAG: DUF6265 family protein [Akkermansiaceae bacterium]|jgi:hypothetical protein|nr:DUF6265 family protein [bacterium]